MYLGAEEKVAPGKNPAKNLRPVGGQRFSPPPAGTFATLLDGRRTPVLPGFYGPGLFLGMVALMKSV